MALVIAALSFNAYVLPFVAPVRSSVRTNGPIMNDAEAAAKAAWLAKTAQTESGAPAAAPAAARSAAPARAAPARAPAPARASPAAAQGGSKKKAPSSGWTLSLAGGERTLEDIKKAQKKAAKAYESKDGCDEQDPGYKGW